MKKMTEEQFRQMIAQLLTTVNPKLIDGDKAQVAMKDPSFPDWFGAFIRNYEVTGKFIAKNNFKLKRDGGICSFLGDNFKAWFGEKVEDPITTITLHPYKLRKASLDGPIITELGGEAKAETALSEIYGLMAKQANGEKGVLLTNGWANIFYIRDQNGILRAVHVYWYGGGWSVNADSVESPCSWHVGGQVFSRNSVPVSSETSVLAQA